MADCDCTATSAITAVTWRVWVSTSASNNTTWTASDCVRPNWCTSNTNTTTANDECWTYWQNGKLEKVMSRVRQETPEEKAAREERERVAAVERQRREEARRFAEVRARELIMQHLDGEQRLMYEAQKLFRVIGSDGARYEIDCRQRQHNVFELNAEGKRVREFCIYQTGDTPLPDNHLAQKLLLEADAKKFKRIANARALMTA